MGQRHVTGQLVSGCFDPIHHTRVGNFEQASDPAEVYAFQIQFQGPLADGLWVAHRLWLRRVTTLAMLTFVALTAVRRLASFHLTTFTLTLRTSFHTLILSITTPFATPRWLEILTGEEKSFNIPLFTT